MNILFPSQFFQFNNGPSTAMANNNNNENNNNIDAQLDNSDDEIEILEDPTMVMVPVYPPVHNSAAVAAAGVNGAMNNDDNDDVQLIGTVGHVPLPHLRQHCTEKQFLPRGGENNSFYCNLCYCYVCDKLASECSQWTDCGPGSTSPPHCHANETMLCWKNQRKRVKKNPNHPVVAASAADDQADAEVVHINDAVQDLPENMITFRSVADNAADNQADAEEVPIAAEVPVAADDLAHAEEVLVPDSPGNMITFRSDAAASADDQAAKRAAKLEEIGNLFPNGTTGLNNSLHYVFYDPSSTQPPTKEWRSSHSSLGWKIITNANSKAQIHYDGEGKVFRLDRVGIEDTSLDGILSPFTVLSHRYPNEGLKVKVSECKPAFQQVQGSNTVYVIYTLKYFRELFSGLDAGDPVPPDITLEFRGVQLF